MAIAFDGGLTCALGVTDLDRSIAWYEKILGFSVLYRMDAMAWCEMSTAVSRVNIGLSQVQEITPKGGATLTFGVTDIDAAKEALLAADVRLDGDGDIFEVPDMVRLLTFYDPDGNALMFYQDLSAK
jgi:catechol 2,3-dioxygenase-like lactoylglutathione lyase family enzyme